MGLTGGGEFKKECKRIAPDACRTVQIDDSVRSEMNLDGIVIDFEATFFPIISGAKNVSEVRTTAKHFLQNLSEVYGCTGEVHMLFEGSKVPVIKQMLWKQRGKDALDEKTIEEFKADLDDILDKDDVAANNLAARILGTELKEERNAVTELMSRLMRTRNYRTRIRRDWVTTMQESNYRNSPFCLVELLDAPYTQLSPPPMLAMSYGAGDNSKKRKVAEDVVPHSEIKVNDFCLITWHESGSRNRSVVRVPEERTGEGEAKIPQVLLRCFREGKRNMLVKSRDSDALVYILLLMRDLINEDGEIGMNVYLDMGPPNFTDPGTLLINVSLLYAKLLVYLSGKWPHVANPVELYLTSFVMAGCDYIESPKGWGIKRFMTAFDSVGHVVLAHAISCSAKADMQGGFIKLDEERFVTYMRMVASVNWPLVVRTLDEDAARGRQDVKDEMNDTNFRTMPTVSNSMKSPNPETVLGREMVRIVADFEDSEMDLTSSQRHSSQARVAFDALVKRLFGMCPTQQQLIEQSVKKRNASTAKTEARKPQVAWTDSQTKAFVRRLTYVMSYFRHSPHGWEEDPLAKDESNAYSKWGWERDDGTGEIKCADFVV